MTNTKSTKNANRTTKVLVKIANPNATNPEEFFTEKELVIPYTRSEKIAFTSVAEMLEDDMMFNIIELRNEPLKKVVYDAQLVFDNMLEDCEDLETANDRVNEGESVIPYTMYYYDAHIWYKFDDDGITNFCTDSFTDSSPLKFGVIDTREFIKMTASAYFDAEIIGLYEPTRTEVKRYAIVPNDKLQACVKKQ